MYVLTSWSLVEIYNTQFYKKPIPATFSGNSLRVSPLRIKALTSKEKGQYDMEDLQAGMKIIGQVVAHEINLEIEGVQDK